MAGGGNVIAMGIIVFVGGVALIYIGFMMIRYGMQ